MSHSISVLCNYYNLREYGISKYSLILPNIRQEATWQVSMKDRLKWKMKAGDIKKKKKVKMNAKVKKKG